tara:strand:+ start:5054 stop:5599 length:546 start_codon:yes stop_codon:yes gene_type:complete
LGGSFDPPHQGHVQISEEALKKLNLKEIWWIVAKKHPEKEFINEKNFIERIEKSKKILKNSRIKIIENLNYCEDKYVINNLKNLIKDFKEKNFIFLIGADNLLNLDKWYKWEEIFRLLPIAVFDRPKYTNISLSSKPANKYRKFKFLEKYSKKLPFLKPPAWIYFYGKKNYSKSSIIRNKE